MKKNTPLASFLFREQTDERISPELVNGYRRNTQKGILSHPLRILQESWRILQDFEKNHNILDEPCNTGVTDGFR